MASEKAACAESSWACCRACSTERESAVQSSGWSSGEQLKSPKGEPTDRSPQARSTDLFVGFSFFDLY